MRDHLAFLGEVHRQYNLAETKNEYNNFRKLYRKRIREVKVDFNDRMIQSSSNPARTMWQIVNNLRGKNVVSERENASITPNEFNTFFSGTAHSVVQGIPKPNNDPNEYLSAIEAPTSAFREVTFNEVREVINGLKNKSSYDIYGLNLKLIKTAKNCILLPLTKLINLCFKYNVFPDYLKLAVVKPIFKKGDPSVPNNYRPISLLPIISKVLEKCIAMQIVNHFEVNELFTVHQWGFRKDRNTVKGILALVSGVAEAFNRKQYDRLCAVT